MLHEALQISRLAKTLRESVDGKAHTSEGDHSWRDREERTQVLKLRWMGLDDEADALERRLGHSFATKLSARYQTAA